MQQPAQLRQLEGRAAAEAHAAVIVSLGSNQPKAFPRIGMGGSNPSFFLYPLQAG